MHRCAPAVPTRREPGARRGAPVSDGIVEVAARLRGPLLVVAVVAGAFLLREARHFLVPLVLGTLLAFLFRPLIRWLERRRLPSLVGSALLVVVVATVAAAAAVNLWAPTRQWLDRVPPTLNRLQERLQPVREPVAQVTEAAREVEEITEVGNDGEAPRTVRLEEPGLVEAATRRVGLFIAEAALTISYLFFVLAFGDSLLERIIRRRAGPDQERRVLEGALETERSISTYLATLTMIYLLLGGATALAMWAAGMPHPVLWGLLAAVLNFVPYLGPLACLTVISAVSLVTFPDPWRALVAPAAYLVLTTVEGNVITPVVLGRRFAVNPLVLFTWVFLWAGMWGSGGALVAVPLLTSLKGGGERLESTRGLVEAVSR